MSPIIHRIPSYCIATVWLINGLYCKVLGYVPRHELIVGKILGNEYAHVLINLIGISEILVSIWVVGKIKQRFCANFQIAIVMLMNIIEICVVRDLLMWGKLNIVFALFFVIFIWLHEYKFNPQTT